MTATVGPVPVPPAPPPPRRPEVLRDDAHALETASLLAEAFAVDAVVRDRERRLPWAELERFCASGLWGITIPREFGGAGVSVETLAEVITTIGAADGSLCQIPQNHFYAIEVLRVGGTPEQQRFFNQRVLAGERFGNALAEIGSKDFKRRTRLEKTSGGWFVTGRKFYCTGAIFAHWIPTLVAGDDSDSPELFLVFVPRNVEGVTVVDDWDGFGQRVTGSGSVIFEQVRIEPEWVVPFTASFVRPTSIGPFAQILHAAIDLGIGLGAWRETLRFVRERSRPWIDSKVASATDDPLTVHQLGDVWVKLRAAQAMVRRAAKAVEEAQLRSDEDSVARASVAVAQARILTTKAGLLASSKLFELSGTASTFEEDGLDRYWRNVRTHTLHDPVRWKYQAVGNYVLSGRKPPRHGAL